MQRVLFDLLVMLVVAVTILFVYRVYGDDIVLFIFGDAQATMYIESTPISVTILDEREERIKGLSGTESLGEFEGMLFIFPEEDFHSIWMKDMLFSIDIVWINNLYQVVHIERNVSPDTYPDSFAPPTPARFVLEVNAFVTANANLDVGDRVTLPPRAVPGDLIKLVE